MSEKNELNELNEQDLEQVAGGKKLVSHFIYRCNRDGKTVDIYGDDHGMIFCPICSHAMSLASITMEWQ